MYDPADIVKNFEDVLNQNVSKPPLALYKDEIKEKSSSFQGQTSYSIREVISNFSKQIKAIQKADTSNTCRQDRQKLNKYKKSSFIPVNMLPRDDKVLSKTPATKFETQFVSDTQLIHLIDNAEALVNNYGITQEFDSTFSQIDVRKQETDENNSQENTTVLQNDVSVNNDIKDLINQENYSSYVDEKNGTDQKIKTNSIELINDCDINTQQHHNIEDINEQKLGDASQLNDNCTEMLNQCIEIEINLNKQDSEQIDDEEIQPSLVFETKKSKTPSPLVFDLSTFEYFEKIAQPIIEKNTDLKSAKQLINSQILGTELFIQTNISPDVSPVKEQISPVLKISAERLKISKNEHTNTGYRDRNTKHDLPVASTQEKDATFLNDEILFSSDEENEYLHKEFHDIPLTCALETSFYEQPDMLDKTMYVGFQTASNRSIQISRESFTKAESLFDETNKDISSKVTLTDLVESLTVKNTTNDLKITDTVGNSLVEKEIDLLKRPDKRKHAGFITASKKKIKLSDMALARCKRVFQEIDIDADYDTEDDEEIKILTTGAIKENFNIQSCYNTNENELNTCADKLENTQIDDDILKEFANDMSLFNDKKLEADMEKEEKFSFQPDAEKAATQKFFSNIDFSDNILDVNKCCQTVQKYSSNNNSLHNNPIKAKMDSSLGFIGFKTAKNNQISISSKALEKAKKLFEDINIFDNEKTDLNSEKIKEKSSALHVEDLNKPSTSFGGFKTASNKYIKVSDKALLRSKNILQDIITSVCESDLTNELNSNSEKVVLDGVILRSKDFPDEESIKNLDEEKQMSHREAKYDHAKELHDDFNEVLDTELMEIEKKHVMASCGFKTASNKPVVISEKALAQSKQVFKDLEVEDDLNYGEKIPFHLPVMIKKSKTNIDVKNPSNKTDNQSFRNITNVSDSTTVNDSNRHSLISSFHKQNTFPGFQTASNKPINISNEALAKTEEVFKNIDKENDDVTVTKDTRNNVDSKTQFERFKTGNNNPITISAEPLAKSTELFEYINESNIEDFAKPISKMELFKGFQTARNKPINITAKALAQSKALFKDIDDKSISYSEENSFKAFQAASKKPLLISSHALAKGKEICKDIDQISLTQNTRTNNLNKQPEAIVKNVVDKNGSAEKEIVKFKELPAFGFRTTSNKSVTITEEALAKSKFLFKDIDKDFDMIERDKKSSDIPEFKGFQTASKKPVQISTDALAKSKALFKDIDEIYSYQENKIKIQTNLEFKGCQTVSNKPVNISEGALARSKALFKDIDNVCVNDIDIENVEYVCANDIDTENNDIPKFIGFQTASKKSVNISEEALARSKALFKDIDNVCVDDISIENVDNVCANDIDRENNDIPKFIGFQTASKKPVKISEEAMAKSKALFKDIDEVSIYDTKKAYDTDLKFIGFEKASKKPFKISKEALAKSISLFKDIDTDENSDLKNTADTDMGFEFKGFKTANKKPVQLSKDAFMKSKELFMDNVITSAKSNKLGLNQDTNKRVEMTDTRCKRIFADIDSFNDIPKDEIPFRGFETASYKKVKISEDALIKSKQIFQDINVKDDCKENLVTTNSNIFQTCNKDEVKISEKAFIDFKILLNERSKYNDVKGQPKIETKAHKEENNIIQSLIDTQVINNFEQTLNTEDFCKETTPKQSKRSGSPILSCPKAKRRKFNTPYRLNVNIPDKTARKSPKINEITIFNDDYKKNKRYTLNDLAKVELATEKIKPYPYILNFNIHNILEFEFDGQRNGVTDKKISIEKLKEYFLGLVNKKLVPNGWLDIQIKLIMWKLISYEIKFTQTLNRVCTAKNVIEQLKYRYDKELYNVERPILRKIMEKDDIASKTMILCVAGMFLDGVSVSRVTNMTSNVELLLTDGWYFVKAIIDKMLTKLVYDERITVGCKLVINGAELVNCDQGIAPWEDTSSVRLKISGNSVRLARWDARLGRHGNGPILSALSSVKVDGGRVSRLRLYVTRVYPMLYVEKFEDGSTVTRSERLENIHQIKYEADRQTAMEKLYEEVEKELSDQESQSSNGSQLKNRNCYESMISESQTKSLEEKSNRERERLLLNIQERVRKKIDEKGFNVTRNVVTLLKIRVAGVEERNGVVLVTRGFMSIWKPNDMLTEIIKEDSWIEVMNVVPTAIRYSEIHLSAGRQTVFKPSRFAENDKIKPYLEALARKCYPVGDLAQNPSMTTECNEVDTVGFVFQIDEESAKQPFQNIYLSDGDKNIICINFWGGLRKFGFQNVLDTGQIISCTNLQKRAGNTRKSIPQFRVTEFTFFTKTPKSLAAKNMIVEIEKRISGFDKRRYCEECIKLKNNYSNKYFIENVSPYRFNDLNLTKNKMFIDSPLIAKREDNLNLTGLDFESTFRQTQELSPKAKERKKKVNEKIARLKMIGEPPPLSPMNIINRSKNALNSYKSPLAQSSVAIAKKSTEISRNDIQSSPVIPMNRTFVKNVNPVKLNFSNVQENSFDEVDHFAEEFDGSPPLSLE